MAVDSVRQQVGILLCFSTNVCVFSCGRPWFVFVSLTYVCYSNLGNIFIAMWSLNTKSVLCVYVFFIKCSIYKIIYL